MQVYVDAANARAGTPMHCSNHSRDASGRETSVQHSPEQLRGAVYLSNTNPE